MYAPSLLLLLTLPAADPMPKADTPKPDAFAGLKLRSIGPARHFRPRCRLRGPREQPRPLLCRRRFRRRLEDGQRRHLVDAGVRRRRLLLHRLRRPRSEESRRRLGRHRREQQPAQRRLRRRRLPLRRRRQIVEERRPEEVRAHRQDRHRPARFRHGLRRRPRTAVGAGRRPRPVQDHRRRQDLEEGPDHQREHRRHRRGARPAQPGRAARRRLPAPPARLDADRRRSGERPLPIDRRRQDLERRSNPGCPTREPRPHRPGRVAGESRRGLRQRRSDRQEGRHLPLHRPRRHLGAAQRLRRAGASTTPTSSPIRRTRTASTS